MQRCLQLPRSAKGRVVRQCSSCFGGAAALDEASAFARPRTGPLQIVLRMSAIRRLRTLRTVGHRPFRTPPLSEVVNGIRCLPCRNGCSVSVAVRSKARFFQSRSKPGVRIGPVDRSRWRGTTDMPACLPLRDQQFRLSNQAPSGDLSSEECWRDQGSLRRAESPDTAESSLPRYCRRPGDLGRLQRSS